MCKTNAIGRVVASVVTISGLLGPAESLAVAEPLRLRGDAIAETQSPTGLIVLSGEDREKRWLTTEGLVWAGTKPTVTGDVLVLSTRLREPHGYGELQAGRFVMTSGAIRPVQIDGARGVVRGPQGTTFETFGGLPVVPRFGSRAYDWIAGARAAQSFVDRATLGVSYVQRRSDGEISNEELGADLAAVPTSWLDVAARGAYDVTSPGIADAQISAAAKNKAGRVELFAADRSPSRLLPATSLFSVLGSFASQSIGSTVKWYAAPRLDVLGSVAGQSVGGSLGANVWVRGLLRLDDRGDGNVGLELRRQDVSVSRFTGARFVGNRAIGHGFRGATELELAVPDEPKGRGAVWPWGLVALSWRSASGWEAATAVEAASNPEHLYEVNVLARLSRAFEVR